MNIEYLINQILPQQEKEYEDGRSFGLKNPIYFVLSLIECIHSEHSDFSPITNLQQKESEWGYVDMALDNEEIEFCNLSNELIPLHMKEPAPVTRFWIDRIVGVFFTYKAAREYLNYQGHNLSDAYIWTHDFGYKNQEADQLLK